MSRSHKATLVSALLISLTGCTSNLATAPSGAVAVPGVTGQAPLVGSNAVTPDLTLPSAGTVSQPTSTTQPGGTTVAPGSSVRRPLAGNAEVAGVPFAGAQVKVFLLGTSVPLATAETDATGNFIVSMPDQTAPGTPLRVVATRDGQTLATLAIAGPAASANHRLLAVDALVLSMATTIAIAALGEGLDEAGLAALKTDGTLIAARVETIVAAFQTLSARAQQALVTAPPEALRQAIMLTLDTNGEGRLTPRAISLLRVQSRGIDVFLSAAVSSLAKAFRPSGGSGSGSNSPAEIPDDLPPDDLPPDDLPPDEPPGPQQGDTLLSGGTQPGLSHSRPEPVFPGDPIVSNQDDQDSDAAEGDPIVGGNAGR